MPNYGKLVAFKFKNLQSWEDKTIKLSSGLTAIEAASETGKSVYIKCLRLGCNYEEYTPLKRRSIIRNWDEQNAEPGVFTVMTSEKYVVQFTFNLTNVHTKILRPDGTVKLIKGPADQEALDILGLVKHPGSSRIVNILDNEEPMLFDGTDNNYNNNVLSGFINHIKMGEMYKTAEENIKYYETQMTRSKRAADVARTKLSILPTYGDVSYVKDNLSILYALDINIEYGDAFYNILNNIKSIEYLPEINTDKLDLIFNHIKFTTNILERIPLDIREYPTTTLHNSLSILLNNMESSTKIINVLDNILNIEYYNTIDTNELDFILQIIKQKTQLLDSLNSMYQITFENTLKSDVSSKINLLLNSINYKNKLLKALDNDDILVEELRKSEAELNRILQLEQEIKNALEYCPLCGEKMSEECEH